TTTPTSIPTVTPTGVPTPGGSVQGISKGSGGGKPGATVQAGSFGYAAADGQQQTVSSVSVSVSRTQVFSSLTLTASAGGEPICSATVSAPDIGSTTVFTFSPTLTIGAGQSVTFALSGVISGGQSGSASARIAFAGIVASGGSSKADSAGVLLLAMGLLGF